MSGSMPEITPSQFSQALALLSSQSHAAGPAGSQEVYDAAEALRNAYDALVCMPQDDIRRELTAEANMHALDAASSGVGEPIPTPTTRVLQMRVCGIGQRYVFGADQPVVFVGRMRGLADVLCTDSTMSRIGAIFYARPDNNMLVVVDPGNRNGMWVVKRAQGGVLATSMPGKRNIIHLAWGENATLNVCGLEIEVFPAPSRKRALCILASASQVARLV